VLATAVSEVSITKDLCADGADVLVENGVHKLIFITAILLVPENGKRTILGFEAGYAGFEAGYIVTQTPM